jgi:hypothetical protein
MCVYLNDTTNPKLPCENISCISFNNDKLYIGTDAGLYTLSKNNKWKRYVNNSQIKSMIFLDKKIYFSAFDGMSAYIYSKRCRNYIFTLKKKKLNNYHFINDLKNDTINGLIWIVSDSLLSINKSKKYFSSLSNLIPSNLTKIATDNIGTLWVGTSNNGLFNISIKPDTLLSCGNKNKSGEYGISYAIYDLKDSRNFTVEWDMYNKYPDRLIVFNGKNSSDKVLYDTKVPRLGKGKIKLETNQRYISIKVISKKKGTGWNYNVKCE